MSKEIRTLYSDEIGIYKKQVYLDYGEKLVCYVKMKIHEDCIIYEYANRENDLPNRVHYYKSGAIKCEEWINDYCFEEYIENGDFDYMQRENDLPNRISYSSNGNVKCREWICDYTKDDGFHYIDRKNDLPNFISYYDNNIIRINQWRRYDDKCFYRENDLPTKINYYKNGAVKSLEWYLKEPVKRLDNQPNYIEYYEDGKIKSEKWFIKSLDRSYEVRDMNLPNCIEYTNKSKHEKWLVKDDKYMNLGDHIPNLILRLNNGESDKFIVNEKGTIKRLNK